MTILRQNLKARSLQPSKSHAEEAALNKFRSHGPHVLSYILTFILYQTSQLKLMRREKLVTQGLNGWAVAGFSDACLRYGYFSQLIEKGGSKPGTNNRLRSRPTHPAQDVQLLLISSCMHLTLALNARNTLNAGRTPSVIASHVRRDCRVRAVTYLRPESARRRTGAHGPAWYLAYRPIGLGRSTSTSEEGELNFFSSTFPSSTLLQPRSASDLFLSAPSRHSLLRAVHACPS